MFNKGPDGELLEEGYTMNDLGDVVWVGAGPDPSNSNTPKDLTEEEIAGLSKGEEDTAIERVLGKNEFTDFFGDMWRAGSQGQSQGDVVDNALEIFGKGKSASDQDIQEFIIAHNTMSESGPSDEMIDFDRVYEEAGGGIFGFIKGLAESPTLAPQLFVSSMSAMVNPASLAAAGATTAGFTGVGALAGGIGAVPGAIASIPFAMGAAGATLETGLSFAEFLNEELTEKGLKFTKEDIKKVLNDSDAMLRIRAKAAGRGAVIGIIDRYSAGLGGKLVGGMVKSGAKKGARILAAAGVEAVGGSAGEAAARLAVGQEMDVKEIGFEGIAGMSTTPVTYAYGTLLAKPVFKVNNGVVDRATILEMINTPDDKAFAGMELEIKNDPELLAIAEERKNKLQQESVISKQLKEAGITDEVAIGKLTKLEREKQALQGNTTRAGKLKLKEIDAKIDAVMEGTDIDITETTDGEGNTTTETVVITDEYAIEKLKEDGIDSPTNEQITIKQAELVTQGKDAIAEMKKNNSKTKQDAIQESSPAKVDVQESAENSKEVGEGDAQRRITTESTTEAETDSKEAAQKEIDTESKDLEGFLGDENLSVTEKVTTKDDTHYSSDTFTEENPNTTIEQHESKIIKLAEKATKSIAKLLPDTKIVMHKSEDAYNEFATNKGTRGMFDPNTNTIHVNIPKANAKTVAHEVFHAVLSNRYDSDVKIAEATKQMVDAVNRKITDKKLKKELQDFSDRYSEFQNEEYLSELVGILSDNYPSLSTPEKSIVKQWLDKLGSMIGISPEIDTDADVLNLLSTIGRSVKDGREISTDDINALNEVDKLNTEDKLQQEQDYESAMDKQRKDAKKMNDLPSGMNAWLAENLGKVHVDDFNQNADRNSISKDKREGLNKLLRKTGPRDIDAINDPFNDDGLTYLEPEVIIEYLLDRADNPGKYSVKNIDKARSMGMTRDQKMQKPKKAGVDKLAKMYGMKSNGVILAKPGVDRVALEEWASSLGFTVKTTPGDIGETTSYQLMKDGKRYKPGGKKRTQREQVADVLNEDMSAVDIINIARENNFRGPAIKDYLVRVKKMKVKEVDALLKVPLTTLSSIPESFTNIKEGMNQGVKFYAKILKETVEWQMKNKATNAQAFDKAVQLLEESAIFKNQADAKRKGLSTMQEQLIVGMQKSLGVRPTKNTNLKLRVLRQSLRDKKRGARELKSVQSKLRNFIRRSLPKKQYNKSEVTTLISDVTNATEANIDNLIQKVIDKITTIQVADLEKSIQKLMDDNYEKIESGREKGKKISVEVNDRLKALKKDLVTDSMVADDVVARNLELNQEFNDINNKSEQLSEDDLNRLTDIAVLINLNNATLMNNTDVNKVESLNRAAELLAQIVGKGKELFKAQLKKDHKRYLKNKETIYESVTGEKIDMSDPDQVEKAKKTKAKGKALKNKRAADGLFKKSVRGLQLALSSFFKGSESLSGLMNTIDRLPGDLIGGKARKMVYSLLNESTRVYKARKMGNKQIIEAKLKEIFGKKWKSDVSAMRKPTDWSATKDIWIDQKEVNEAELAYKNNPTRKNKLELKKIKDENAIVMTQDEILYQYQQFQDPANLASFMNEDNFLYRGDPKRILESLMEQVDPKNKEVGDWLVEEFYPSLYEYYNKIYKAIYRTNLPWNDMFSGRIYREFGVPNPLDLLGTDVKSNNQVSAASTKVRRANSKPIVKMGMMNVLMTYTTDMEWFASHAEAIRDINKMFDDPLIAQAIEQNNSEGTLLLIRNSIDQIARRGINNAARGKFMNTVNNMFIAARLGANPTIFLKQMTSFITFSNDIGIANYTKYAAINKTQALKVYKEIWNNSVYVQDRASERIEDVLESYASLGNVEFSTKENYITKLMMSPVKYGDLGAIFLGGSPNYSYYKAEFQKKNPTATEQQAIDHAIRRFEDDTKNTQQSSDLQDKDFYQTSDPIIRSFNMFLTTPKQYLRKEFGAIRNLYRKLASWDSKAGQGTVTENIRQLAMYHFVMPMFFQFVAMGFPDLGDLEDEEKEDLLRAAIIGNFNALFIAGDVLAMAGDAIQEKPWAGTTKSLAPLNVMSEIANLYTRAERLKDPVKKAELTQKMMLRITEVALTPTGRNLPLVNIAKYAKNLNKLGESGGEKDFLRLFNYSEYVIDKDDEKGKLSKKEMKLYFPDLYEQEMARDKELKALNKELGLY